MKDCLTFSFDTPTNLPIKIIKGKSTFATIPLNLWERKISFPRKMVKTRSNPPANMRKTTMPRATLKIKGREGWMFFNPTMGTYQSKKMRKKRIRQVNTRSPIKILF
jgi:hypothetical protein